MMQVGRAFIADQFYALAGQIRPVENAAIR